MHKLTSINSFILYRIKNLGYLPICNLKKQRAPHIAGVCLPLCWRCLSIMSIAYLSDHILSKLLFLGERNLVSILLIIPCAVDGGIQLIFNIKSTNLRRAITGSLAGRHCDVYCCTRT